jgi:hypothetical protein
MKSESNNRPSGFTIRHLLFTVPRIVAAEVKDSFLMAMGSLLAHKLRSALTLLGVTVGVFSIIVVMTAMRAMEKNIEHNLAQLGSDTFVVSKWPRIHFDRPSGNQEYWRRKNITLEQGHASPQHRPGTGNRQRQHDVALFQRPAQRPAAR